MSVNDETHLEVHELGRLLEAVEPAALLVPARLLRRVIKHDRKLTTIGLRVPHRKSYVINREKLLELADLAELEVGPERSLRENLMLLVRPEAEELAAQTRGQVLLCYWRLLFHACVHRSIAKRIAEHRLTKAMIQARIQQIGRTEFAEIRTVLRQEKFLLPPRDDAAVYEEFAAVFLELRFFAKPLLRRTFPGLEDLAGIEQILAEDVDGAAVFAATRLPGAPDTVPPPAEPEQVEKETALSLDQVRLGKADLLTYSARADKAAAAGNVVRAAIIRTRSRDTTAAREELDRLVQRITPALHLSEEEAKQWRQALPTLLAPAACGIWPAEARLLYDLQKVCVDHERPVSSLEIGEWAYSYFRQPLVRPLPDQSLVLAVRHLRRALDRLPASRVTNAERHALAGLLHKALHYAEIRLRDRFRPVVNEALKAVGLSPQNLPERVAHDKLVLELLDHVTDRGYLNMGDLRDALSRNQLKLADMGGVGEFLAGDALIRGNRALAERAAGVYRRGPIYLRWLQRLSALTFGTQPGRWLTLFLALPFGGAFATIIMVQEILHLLHLVHHHEPAALEITVGAVGINVPRHHPLPAGILIASGILGVFYLLLLHVRPFREIVGRALRLGWQVSRAVLIDLPIAALRVPVIRRFFESMTFLLFLRYVIKPLPPALLTWAILIGLGVDSGSAMLGGLAMLLALSALINSRLGRRLEEIAADWLVHRWEHLRGLLPGLFRLVMDFFKRILEAVDRFLYTVDEWFRFRRGQGRLTLVAKIVLGFFWSIVAYFVRLFVNVFIEPTVNPLKHFPAVTVMAKLLVPFWPFLIHHMEIPFLFLGKPLAFSIAFLMLHSIPGAAGFLVWELKENWRLYRANRERNLGPVLIGHHGETMLRLLKPGFHSGTLPKLYAKLRRAERRAFRRNDWGPARQLRENLHHVEDALRRFTERELLAFLAASKGWPLGPVGLAAVEAFSNRIRLELACPALGAPNLELKFEERAGWLLAHIGRPGWLPRLSSQDRAVFSLALAGFYKKAGVGLIREQIEACFAPDCPHYDISAAGLVVWPGKDYETELVYDLDQGQLLKAKVVEGSMPTKVPEIKADELIFNSRPLSWQDWVQAWQRDQAGESLVEILSKWQILPLKGTAEAKGK